MMSEENKNDKLFRNLIKCAASNKELMKVINNNEIIPDISYFNKVFEVQNLKGINFLRNKYGKNVDLLNDNKIIPRAFKEKKNKIIKWLLLRSTKDFNIKKEVIKNILDLDIVVDKEIIIEIIDKYDHILNDEEVLKYIKYNFMYLFKDDNFI